MLSTDSRQHVCGGQRDKTRLKPKHSRLLFGLNLLASFPHVNLGFVVYQKQGFNLDHIAWMVCMCPGTCL